MTTTRENLNAPSLVGIVIAAGMAVVAFGVAKVVGGFDYTPAVFIGVLVFLFVLFAYSYLARGSAAGSVAGSAAVDGSPASVASASANDATPATAKPAMAETAPAVAAAVDTPAAPLMAASASAPAAVKATAKAEQPEVSAKAATPKSPAKAAKADAPAKAGKTDAAAKVAPASVADLPAGAGTKPAALAAARGGVADDLKKIEGIGPVLEKLCHELGIFHFDQIAQWGAPEVAWMDSNLKGFKGRVTRDKWVAQAKLIGEVGMEEFLRRAKTNDY